MMTETGVAMRSLSFGIALCALLVVSLAMCAMVSRPAEANDELLNTVDGGVPGTPGIPAAPGDDVGTGGTGMASADANTSVHVHRGALGDTDSTGGPSDLDSRIHRWLNPVALLRIAVE